jgi:hypothetical protein
MRAVTKRLGRIRNAIDAAPVRRHLVREAYEWFHDFGELPDDDDHLAYDVVQQALHGGEEGPIVDTASAKKPVPFHQRERPSETWPPSVRAMLFDEALFAPAPLRKVARAAIAVEVTFGGDVENAAFGARHGMPTYGCVALHCLGYPKRLAIPPYEEQAKRLFVRLDDVRGRAPQDDPRWFEEQARAVVTFRRTGALPSDEMHLDALLVDVELDLLVAHKRRRDVGEAMGWFDQAARGNADERGEALRRLSEAAKAGRLRWSR